MFPPLNSTVQPGPRSVTREQFRHAMRVLRTNGMDYAQKFFRSYPERLAAIEYIDGQKRDALEDRAYMAAIGSAS